MERPLALAQNRTVLTKSCRMSGRTLRTGRNQGVVGHNVWLAALAVHLVEQLQGKLPAASLLAGTDQAGVGYHVSLTSTRHHVLHACTMMMLANATFGCIGSCCPWPFR